MKLLSDLTCFHNMVLLYLLIQNNPLSLSILLLIGKMRQKWPILASYYSDSNRTSQSQGLRIQRQLLQFRCYRLFVFLAQYRLSWLPQLKSLYFYFFFIFYAFFFVLYSIPIRFRISVRRVCLIFLSMGEEELKDGQTLTSISHGLSLSSIKISNPQS